MSIELKGNNYYSMVFKRANYKLLNSMFWVVIRALDHFSAWRSKPPCLLVYDVQSHLSQLLARSYKFRFDVQSRVFVSTWCSEPWPTFVSAFKVVFSFLHGVQSHGLPSFRRLEPCFRFCMVFRAIAYLRFGVQSRILFLHGVQSHCLSSFRCSKPLHLRSVFKTTSYLHLGI